MFVFSKTRSVFELLRSYLNLAKVNTLPLSSSNVGVPALLLRESLKKQTLFPVFSLERKTTFWAGNQFYVEMWPALRKGSGWSYSQRTLNTIGTRGGKKNYDNGDYDDDDDDDYDDDDDDDDDYNVFSSS